MTSYHIVSLITMVMFFFHKFSQFVARKAILDRICLAIDINRKMVLHSEMAWSNVIAFLL